MRVRGMAQTVCVIPSAADLTRLSAIDAARHGPSSISSAPASSCFGQTPFCPGRRPAGRRRSGPRYDAGNSATPKKASNACCATDPPAWQAAPLHRYRRRGARP